jgi:hypothetical protein
LLLETHTHTKDTVVLVESDEIERHGEAGANVKWIQITSCVSRKEEEEEEAGLELKLHSQSRNMGEGAMLPEAHLASPQYRSRRFNCCASYLPLPPACVD